MTATPPVDVGHLVHVSGRTGLYRVRSVDPGNGTRYCWVRRAGSLNDDTERVPASAITPAPDAPRFRATIPPAVMYAWESQARQYPFQRSAGLHTEENRALGKPIVCLLWYGPPPGTRHIGPRARLNGILNYYPEAIPPYQRAGTINVWVHHLQYGHGIATYLVRTAITRYGVDLTIQNYSPAGARLAESIIRRDER